MFDSVLVRTATPQVQAEDEQTIFGRFPDVFAIARRQLALEEKRTTVRIVGEIQCMSHFLFEDAEQRRGMEERREIVSRVFLST